MLNLVEALNEVIGSLYMVDVDKNLINMLYSYFNEKNNHENSDHFHLRTILLRNHVQYNQIFILTKK
ncbi:hypothetical protein J2Z40_003758 [Cytobacillus eiseniae]|uniref:Uncharacterized protein n=1 Tax=Cytobacillus eiseniae TaxID=762947 RepID=A0ABS4RJT7_9BACI|nr:hypothetical protein [Cytobacillus eiseniae]